MTGDRELPNDEALPEGLLELLQAEQQAPGPSAASHDRVLQQLEQTLGLPPPGGGGGGGDGGAAAAASGAVAAGGGSKAALTAAVALAFAAGAGAGAFGHARLAPTPAPSVEVRTVVSVERIVEHVSAPPPVPTAVASASAPAAGSAPRARPSVAPTDPAARDRALADENALIARAQAALSRGNLVQAKAALREHAARFPSGQLSEERRLLEQHTQNLEKSP